MEPGVGHKHDNAIRERESTITKKQPDPIEQPPGQAQCCQRAGLGWERNFARLRLEPKWHKVPWMILRKPRIIGIKLSYEVTSQTRPTNR